MNEYVKPNFAKNVECVNDGNASEVMLNDDGGKWRLNSEIFNEGG